VSREIIDSGSHGVEGTPRATGLLYATDAYQRDFEAVVTGEQRQRSAVALETTAFFPTGGGQPHDTGVLKWGSATARVVDATKGRDGVVWHTVEGPLPPLGSAVTGEIDWDRRYLLMRTHTALHILNGLIWVDHVAHVTGASMTPGEGRLDFELPSMSRDFGEAVTRRINEFVRRDLPVGVEYVPRAEADTDPSLMRLKANLIPRSVDPLRVIDIVGLDRQADGGTHVASTAEVGEVRVVRTESKGKANKRIRIAVQ
jgi:misacylated tRNA(Ala) deacylase